MPWEPRGSVSPRGFFSMFDKGATGMERIDECILPRRSNEMISNDPEQRYVEAIGAYLDGLPAIPDGFVCTEYAIARALYAASAARGLLPGRDFRACCIDENELATRGAYFTHMRQDEQNLARETVDILLRLLGGATDAAQDRRVPAVFHQGETT